MSVVVKYENGVIPTTANTFLPYEGQAIPSMGTWDGFTTTRSRPMDYQQRSAPYEEFRQIRKDNRHRAGHARGGTVDRYPSGPHLPAKRF